MRLSDDVTQLLSAFSAHEVRYLLVGAHALAAHGLPRATGDVDLWVQPTSGNAARVWAALHDWIGVIPGLGVEDFARPGTVVQLGVAPWRLDILTQIDGVAFVGAWRRRVEVVLGPLRVPVLSRADIMRNKAAAGRPKDLADLAWLRGEVEE